jgi:hypothetical protein
MTQNQPEPRFDYFMLRVSRSEHEPDLFEGQVERLGSGEKRRFESGDELLRLVADWRFTFDGVNGKR